MKVSYEDRPVEGHIFRVSAEHVAGRAPFNAYLNGELFWEHECPDPPCHEQLRVPPSIAGGILLITVRDREEEHELTFFINDDGEGVPEKPRQNVCVIATVAMDPELLKAKLQLLSAIITASGTIFGAMIVGIFGTLITRKYSREKDRQEKEAQWRDHAIELTKLDLERKLKRYEADRSISMRLSILDFLANYRDLLELDKVAPKALYLHILENRIKQLGSDKAKEQEIA